MKHKALITGFAFLFLLVMTGAFAVEISMDESVGTEDRSIDDDYLFLGETLNFSGESDSLIFFGKSLLMSGANRGNLVAAAETMDVHGRVADDSFIAARTLNISGTLGSTTFAAAEKVNFLDGARAEGALFAAGREVRIAGTLLGDLFVGAGHLVVSGRVEGDVRVGAERITLEPGAVITGNFTYESKAELSQEELALVQGSVTYREAEPEKTRGDMPVALRAGKWVIGVVLLLSALVFALLFYLFPGLRNVGDPRKSRRFWITVAWGLIPFFGYPLLLGAVFLAGILFGITVPIGLVLLFSLGLLCYVLTALALPQIGNYTSLLFSWRTHEADPDRPYRRTLLGFVPVFILGLVPIVSMILWVFVLSLGWGIAIERLFKVRLGAGSADG